MLSNAITVLFAFTGLIAVATIAVVLRDALALYRQLLREAEMLRAGFAGGVQAAQTSLRPKAAPARHRVAASRRPALALLPARPAFAAA